MTISLSENSVTQGELLTNESDLRQQVAMAVKTIPVIDVHSHVFPPEFRRNVPVWPLMSY